MELMKLAPAFNAAAFFELFTCSEVDACWSGTEAAGVNAEDEAATVVVGVVFGVKFFDEFEHVWVLLGIERFDSLWKFFWRLKWSIKINDLLCEHDAI